MKAIIGKKVGMSQIFDENGKVIPVTVIEAGHSRAEAVQARNGPPEQGIRRPQEVPARVRP